MRIDYFLVSESMADRLESSEIHGVGIEREGTHLFSKAKVGLEPKVVNRSLLFRYAVYRSVCPSSANQHQFGLCLLVVSLPA